MKKIIKIAIVASLAVIMLCTTSVLAATVGLTATLNTNRDTVNYTYTPGGGTYQKVYLSGYQKHPQSGDCRQIEEGAEGFEHSFFGGNTCSGTFSSFVGYKFLTLHDGTYLKVKAVTDGAERALVYPQ